MDGEQTAGAGVTATMAGHQYLSTSCLHGHHDYCQATAGSNGTTQWDKTPASCKFCGSACTCPCHGGAPPEEDVIRDAMAEATASPGRVVTTCTRHGVSDCPCLTAPTMASATRPPGGYPAGTITR